MTCLRVYRTSPMKLGTDHSEGMNNRKEEAGSQIEEKNRVIEVINIMTIGTNIAIDEMRIQTEKMTAAAKENANQNHGAINGKS